MADDDLAMLELRLRSLDQLFNLLDPMPFHEKDLDPDAEAFIGDWAAEPDQRGRPLGISIHIEEAPREGDAEVIVGEAIRNFFAYQASVERGVFRRFRRDAQVSLVIGLVFITVCLSAASLLPQQADSPFLRVIAESLLVAGWVGMWRPIEMLLYDWWPIRRRIAVFDRLGRVTVSVALGPKAHRG